MLHSLRSLQSHPEAPGSNSSLTREIVHTMDSISAVAQHFFRRIAVQYQMALDASGEENFNTRNPEDTVRLIENLTSTNSTNNTDFERRQSANILGKEQMDEVKAKLDSVHKLLRKQACLVDDADAVDTKDIVEEDVNFIGGTGFQRSGNQGGNFYVNGKMSNLIDHGFYPLLAIVYRCFKVYLLRYRVYLE